MSKFHVEITPTGSQAKFSTAGAFWRGCPTQAGRPLQVPASTERQRATAAVAGGGEAQRERKRGKKNKERRGVWEEEEEWGGTGMQQNSRSARLVLARELLLEVQHALLELDHTPLQRRVLVLMVGDLGVIDCTARARPTHDERGRGWSAKTSTQSAVVGGGIRSDAGRASSVTVEASGRGGSGRARGSHGGAAVSRPGVRARVREKDETRDAPRQHTNCAGRARRDRLARARARHARCFAAACSPPFAS